MARRTTGLATGAREGVDIRQMAVRRPPSRAITPNNSITMARRTIRRRRDAGVSVRPLSRDIIWRTLEAHCHSRQSRGRGAMIVCIQTVVALPAGTIPITICRVHMTVAEAVALVAHRIIVTAGANSLPCDPMAHRRRPRTKAIRLPRWLAVCLAIPYCISKRTTATV